MNEKLQIAFGLFGGLAIFLYGMNLMSECLQKAAGEKMKHILAILTKNPVMGALAGALVTAVLQSSSATTVMAIGFVSAGLMTLPQGISIILGANIGTTMTAQIIAFNLSDYIYLIIFVGFIFSFVCKKEKTKNIALTIFAFGLLFLGIDTMGSVMSPLAESPVFVNMIAKVTNIPILGLLVGMCMTLVVQSSSATIAVLQNFAMQPAADGVSSIIGLTGALPILFGDNIGTTITAVLASIGQSKDAKRTAAAHCIFNVSGSMIFIWFIKPYAKFIQWISPKGPEIEVISRQIANAHTGFNVTMVLIWIPLLALMIKIVMFIIPEGGKGKVDPMKPMYLDEHIVNQPSAALQLATKEIIRCSEIAGEMIQSVRRAVQEGDLGEIANVKEQGAILNHLYGKVTDYFSEIFASGAITETQANQTATLMHLFGDVDRIGVLSVEIAQSLRKEDEKKYKYSDDAIADMQESLEIIHSMYNDALETVATGNLEKVEDLHERNQKITDLDIKMRKDHMKRVNKGKCKSSLTAPFNKILSCIDRMGNSCVNIADEAREGLNYKYFLDDFAD